MAGTGAGAFHFRPIKQLEPVAGAHPMGQGSMAPHLCSRARGFPVCHARQNLRWCALGASPTLFVEIRLSRVDHHTTTHFLSHTPSTISTTDNN